MGRQRTGSVLPYGERWKAAVGKEYLGIFTTEAEGWRAVKAFLATESDSGTARDSCRVLFEEWLDKRELAGHVRRVKKERSLYRQHILTADWIDWPARKVKPLQIQLWFSKLLSKEALSTITMRDGEREVIHRATGRKLSRKVVTNVRSLAKAFFAQMLIEAHRTHVTSNPVEPVLVPKVAVVVEDEDTWAFLTPAEIKRLFDLFEAGIADQRRQDKSKLRTKPWRTCYLKLRAVYAVAIYAGLRDGELIGLRWQDVELEGDSPHLKVRRSYNGAVKAQRSRRDVPLLEYVRRALREWKVEWQREMSMRSLMSPLVFPSDHGGCYSEGYDFGWDDQQARADRKDRPSRNGELRTTRVGWKTKAQIRDYVTFHDLRHTCGSHLAMGTWGRAVEPLKIMKWLGHADIKTTMIYVDLSPDSIHGEARLMRMPKRAKRGTDE